MTLIKKEINFFRLYQEIDNEDIFEIKLITQAKK
jgi:hypothetical protein